jgi:murein DD-endopeptidase MepM/ murein hydrolase activator NlpD
MADGPGHRKKWIDRVRRRYRLVILNNDTFEEVSSHKISLLNFYILLSSILMVGAIVVFVLIFFTPLKQVVPGYGDVTNQQVYLDMYDRVTELEEALTAQRLYTNKFRKLLTAGSADAEEEFTEAEYEEALSSLNSLDIEVPDLPPDREDEEPAQQGEEDQGETTRVLSNSLEPEASLDDIYLITPLHGEISAGFKPEVKHYGLDIMAPKNTPIKAISDGIVIDSDWSLESGNTISILHKNNLVSIYKHNSVLLKVVGEKVAAGEAIAIIGNTGTLSDGPHLHFELWHNGKAIDPKEILMF